jgi:hypothetical protein
MTEKNIWTLSNKHQQEKSHQIDLPTIEKLICFENLSQIVQYRFKE